MWGFCSKGLRKNTPKKNPWGICSRRGGNGRMVYLNWKKDYAAALISSLKNSCHLFTCTVHRSGRRSMNEVMYLCTLNAVVPFSWAWQWNFNYQIVAFYIWERRYNYNHELFENSFLCFSLFSTTNLFLKIKGRNFLYLKHVRRIHPHSRSVSHYKMSPVAESRTQVFRHHLSAGCLAPRESKGPKQCPQGVAARPGIITAPVQALQCQPGAAEGQWGASGCPSGTLG